MTADSPFVLPTAAPKLFYSTDGENFPFDNARDALDDLASRGKLEIGATYESGEFSPADPMRALNPGDLLEHADEYLSDNGALGEDQSYFEDFGAHARLELAELLHAWHDKHKPSTTLWASSGKTTLHTVTAEDIDAYRHGTP